jgi:hypothetical protein
MNTGQQAPHIHTLGGKKTSGMGQHTHDLAEVVAALALLSGRLEALTARVAKLESAIITPPTPPPVKPGAFAPVAFDPRSYNT